MGVSLSKEKPADGVAGQRSNGKAQPELSGYIIALIFPEVLEPIRTYLCVSAGVLDVLVHKLMLYGSRIVPLVGQLESSSVTQHMWVYREAQLCPLRSSQDHLLDV
jgi:hypothetical protein